VVVLKRLTDSWSATATRCWRLVRGSAVNQDTAAPNGVTSAHNTAAQCDVIADALRSGDVAPESVDYVECPRHRNRCWGIRSSSRRWRPPTAGGEVAVRAGGREDQPRSPRGGGRYRSGFIKAALSVQHAEIHAESAYSRNGIRPSMPRRRGSSFPPSTLRGQPRKVTWGRGGRLVSSFGLGGTNAHVIIEQGPELAPVAGNATDAGVSTLVVTGKTPQRVAATSGGCWPIGWRAPAPRWRWPTWPTRSIITVPSRPNSVPSSPGSAPRRWPG